MALTACGGLLAGSESVGYAHSEREGKTKDGKGWDGQVEGEKGKRTKKRQENVVVLAGIFTVCHKSRVGSAEQLMVP